VKKTDVVRAILADRQHLLPCNTEAEAYASSNIALCKYWGKRNTELNLPMTSSFSISLGNFGSNIRLSVNENVADTACINDQLLDWQSSFGKRLREFLNLFRITPTLGFHADIHTNIPIGAGLASSACGFASLVQALDRLFGWELSLLELSILARLGSGSASRSLWQGFVEWHAGTQADGMDSYAEVCTDVWPDLCIGLLILSDTEKKISSRVAMQRTVATSPFYTAWPETVRHDLSAIKQAVREKDFLLLGKTAESNALSMHATMLSSWPPVLYALPGTVTAMQKIWELRQAGLMVFFTQDAGPNLKLLFLAKDKAHMKTHFPNMPIIQPFINE